MNDGTIGKDANDESIRSALDDHRECMQVVAAVEACLEEHLDRDGGWIGRLVPRLETMIGTLRAHFCEEEQESLYRELPQRCPRFADRLERLEAEHSAIVEQATELIGRAATIDHTRIHELHEFNAGTQLLVARIRRHEAEENEIVLTAHWQEFGGEGD